MNIFKVYFLGKNFEGDTVELVQHVEAKDKDSALSQWEEKNKDKGYWFVHVSQK
ncbi:hypothetical protein Xmau_03867 [Xenorhabdus mauleonii]|uniref:Uncharacterized protein n=1 Tax=Xenorhabdus mauleonii TaxID=351675 RepID=A0A1I3V6T3_9GAMM|nr:hypothetical protein [Xenorhabdus mauleonii]PHM37649.1 hypothetical protein Xmau_03867 [Xenorhabdus mauleonii]SFJ90862.1 hypothetical protein SAMN05421680_11971 [Xenorhabdus mauleonii]